MAVSCYHLVVNRNIKFSQVPMAVKEAVRQMLVDAGLENLINE